MIGRSTREKPLETTPFTEADRAQMRSLGIGEEKALAQLEIFRHGQVYARLERACTLNDGIVKLSPAEMDTLAAAFTAEAARGRVMQFVPASGAATRMFKSLMGIWNRPDKPAFAALAKEGGNGEVKEFLEWMQGLDRFPFYADLQAVMAREGLDLGALAAAQDYRTILEFLLMPRGLGYAYFPKALIPFHRYGESDARTPLEEHLAEAAALARDAEGVSRLHLTVSPEHESSVQAALERIRARHEVDGRFEIGLSFQKPSTHTLAVDGENRPFRNPDQTLLFRPGGHGALLENLYRTGGDIVFLRNVDNVSLDRNRAAILSLRRALGGYLVRLQARVFEYMDRLEAYAPGEQATVPPGADPVEETSHFVEQRLGTLLPESLRGETAPREEKRAYLLKIMDRPLRVCAMVRNQGEPGGGPFWVRHKDGSLRLQIVETGQVDMGNSQQRKILESSTHFNPTDLACALRNRRGDLFKLQDYVDPDACFVTQKSQDGRPLKALELPGLWNGSMAHWNSAFVEFPVETFNPVKTVVDLRRPSHQG